MKEINADNELDYERSIFDGLALPEDREKLKVYSDLDENQEMQEPPIGMSPAMPVYDVPGSQLPPIVYAPSGVPLEAQKSVDAAIYIPNRLDEMPGAIEYPS